RPHAVPHWLQSDRALCPLTSFPTRRSSDLDSARSSLPSSAHAAGSRTGYVAGYLPGLVTRHHGSVPSFPGRPCPHRHYLHGMPMSTGSRPQDSLAPKRVTGLLPVVRPSRQLRPEAALMRCGEIDLVDLSGAWGELLRTGGLPGPHAWPRHATRRRIRGAGGYERRPVVDHLFRQLPLVL